MEAFGGVDAMGWCWCWCWLVVLDETLLTLSARLFLRYCKGRMREDEEASSGGEEIEVEAEVGVARLSERGGTISGAGEGRC